MDKKHLVWNYDVFSCYCSFDYDLRSFPHARNCITIPLFIFSADREVQRILLELLNQMDGFDQTVNVKVGISVECFV